MKIIFLLLLISIYATQTYAYEEKRVLLTLDKETKDKMLKNMRNYLRLTNDMVEAISRDDFKKVEMAADKLGMHPNKKENIYKKGNPEFIRQALEFHSTGVELIKTAAQTKDKNKTLKSINEFMNRCVQCHDMFRVN